jgi:hypothetical protein
VAVPDGTIYDIVLSVEDRQRLDEIVARKNTTPLRIAPPCAPTGPDAMTGCGPPRPPAEEPDWLPVATNCETGRWLESV